MSSPRPPAASAPPSTINVWAEESFYAIPCAQGQQPVRWLALSALQRHAAAARMRGAVRARDAAADSPSACSGVLSVTCEFDGSFIGPDVTCADLRRRLLEIGGPEAVAAGLRLHLPPRTPAGARPPHDPLVRAPLWHSLAFHYSPDGREHANGQLAVFRAEKARLDAAAAVRREANQQEQMVSLGRMLASDVDDVEQADQNFLFDWSNVRVKNVTSDAEEIKKMRRLLRQSYTMVVDLFRHFSGGSSKGSTASIQKQELTHMLHLCQGVDIIKERPLLDKLFIKANSNRGGDASMADDRDVDSLARYELLEFIVMLADAKYGREVDLRTGVAYGPVGALQRFLTEKIGALHMKLNAGPVRAALKEPSIHKFLLPRLPVLMKVYQYYAAVEGSAGAPAAGGSGGANGGAGVAPAPPPPLTPAPPKPMHGGGAAAAEARAKAQKASLMDLDEFVLLLEHAGLLDDVSIMTTSTAAAAAALLKTTKATLTSQEVRETFSGVQRESDGSAADDEHEELTFGEFLEAIGRTAIAKWGDAVGLRFVLDPRQNALRGGAAAGSGASAIGQDQLAKGERVFVRALIMWAYEAVCQLASHIGSPISVPLQYDTNELARLVTMGIQDLPAAAAGMGVSAAQLQGLDEAGRDKDGTAGADGAASHDDAMGAEIFSDRHPLRPKTAFGALKVPARPATAEPGSRRRG